MLLVLLADAKLMPRSHQPPTTTPAGWFTQPSPFFEGGLSEEQAAGPLAAAMESFAEDAALLPPATGIMTGERQQGPPACHLHMLHAITRPVHSALSAPLHVATQSTERAPHSCMCCLAGSLCETRLQNTPWHPASCSRQPLAQCSDSSSRVPCCAPSPLQCVWTCLAPAAR